MAATAHRTAKMMCVFSQFAIRRDMMTCTAATNRIGCLALDVLMSVLLAEEALPKSTIPLVVLATKNLIPNQKLFAYCRISMVRVLEFDK